jgi:hypothetical protein
VSGLAVGTGGSLTLAGLSFPLPCTVRACEGTEASLAFTLPDEQHTALAAFAATRARQAA